MKSTLVEVINNNIKIFQREKFLSLHFPSSATEVYSYSQIIAQAKGWCMRFREIGAKPGDVIAIMLLHSKYLYSTFLGAIWAGCIPTMFPVKSEKFNNTYLHDVLAGLFDNSAPLILVTDADMNSVLNLDEYALKFHFHLLISDFEKIVPADNVKPAAVTANDTVFLQYSSGTTGAKKGVAVSHRALLKQLTVYADAINLDQKDNIVSWLPLYHDMGLITSFLLPIVYVVPIVAISAFDWIKKPAMLIQIMSRYRNVMCWLPNFSFEVLSGLSVDELELVKVNLGKIKALINCSEPISESSYKNFIKRYHKYGLKENIFSSCYALAENTFAVTSCIGTLSVVDSVDGKSLKSLNRAIPYTGHVNQEHKNIVSSGVLLKSTQLKICTNKGELCEERTVGEIFIASESLFTGYYHNNRLTSKVLNNGWYRTGDLGYISNGHLFLLGRLDDVLVIRGENFYAQDIELVLNRISGVIPGRVIAFTVDDNSGSAALVVIVESKNTEIDFRINLSQKIVLNIKDHIAIDVYEVLVFDERWLEKSTSGKISRSRNKEKYLNFKKERLKQVCKSCLLYYPDDKKRQSICKSIIQLLDNISLQYITVSNNAIEENLIFSGNIDSLGIVSMGLTLEKKFDIRFDSEEELNFQNFLSVKAMVELIQKKLSPLMMEEYRGESVQGFSKSGSIRDDKSSYYINSEKDHNLIILGSSTSWPLSSLYAKKLGYVSFNFSVESAMPEDWICTIKFVLDRCISKPQIVILGVDIEAFSDYLPIDPRLLKCSLLNSYLELEDKYLCKDVEQVVSKSLTRSDELLHKFRSIDTEKFDNYEYGFNNVNGDFVYLSEDKQMQNFNLRRPMKLENSSDRDHMYLLRFKKYNNIDKKRLLYFIEFIEFCRKNGISIRLFFPPLHNKLRDFLCKKTTYTIRKSEIKNVISKIVNNSKGNVKFWDFSDTHSFKGSELDFRNAAHAGAYNNDIILDKILNQLSL